ncbi:VOC family protein [Tepidibacter mesophilus]|uniref:VOC family protein n=1 Tax=Tepidibacter mesophilus TaxID=655607 RepID=UPI000C07496C|nr:VOC family protein [Tepidibacter mesophilus]
MSKTLEAVTFLSMNGNTRETIEFYKTHFGAEVEMLVTYEDIGKMDPTILITEGNKNLISHSVLKIGCTKIMLAENTMDPKEKYNRGNNFSICIQSADLEEIKGFYNSLISDENVKIIIPLAENIFSKAYGIIEDPFNVQIQLMFDHRL